MSEPLLTSGPPPIQRLDPLLGICFEQIDRWVYMDGQLIGRYSRVGVGCISAFDACGMWIGDYKKQSKARAAIAKRWERLLNTVNCRKNCSEKEQFS